MELFIVTAHLLTVLSLALADRHDQPPDEDALEAVADEHVTKENDDIFWFAFLVGGIGSVVLVIRFVASYNLLLVSTSS